MTRFRDLNPATMPGYGDPETWGGRRPPEPLDNDEPEISKGDEFFPSDDDYHEDDDDRVEPDQYL